MAREIEGVPRAGEVIAGKYRVVSVLGAGGMGAVLAADHLELGRRVAVKFLLPGALDQPDAVARFQREARALAGIQSEHVVRVLDVARLESGAPFMVMEYLHGVDLEAMATSRGPLPIEEVVEYVLQAGEAIAEAHSRGIVHRDLKPANLFLTHRADGSPLVKVLDFGISKVKGAGATENLTGTADVFGTPAYMSPEQLRSAKETDLHTDIWALGAILHRLVAGRLPFDADGVPKIIARILVEPPTPLREHRGDAPSDLEAVVQRCLEKDVARRFHSLGELARALRPFAPPHAVVSVERISLMLDGLDALATTEPAPTRPRTDQPATRIVPTVSMPAGVVDTESAVSSTLTRQRHRRVGAIVAAVGAAAAALAALGLMAFRGRAVPSPAATISPPAVAIEPAPVVVATEPAPVVEAPAPPAEPSATAASAPSSSAPRPANRPKAPVKAPAVPKRPMGDSY